MAARIDAIVAEDRADDPPATFELTSRRAALPAVRRRRPRLRLVPRRRRARRARRSWSTRAFAIEQYLDAAAAAGVRIVRVLETHTHADHVSGHGRFALEHGVPVSIHPLARARVPVRRRSTDGEVVRVGSVEIRVLHTPGHRPEHCAFVVDGELVLTGDSLFVGEAARPDLAIEAREGAADLCRSLRRLAELPDAVVVYPGHVSGSLCGTNMSDERSTTIGREKRDEPRSGCATSGRSCDESGVADDAAAADDRALRRAQPRPVGRGAAAARASSTIPATRPCSTSGRSRSSPRATSTGAISVALDGGSFATRAAFVLEPGEPFVLHARLARRSGEAAAAAAAVGLFDRARLRRRRRRDRDDSDRDRGGARAPARGRPGLQVLDVRETSERDEARLPARSSFRTADVRAPRPARSTGRGRCTRSARAARARRSPRACSRAWASTPGRPSAAACPSSTASARASVASAGRPHESSGPRGDLLQTPARAPAPRASGPCRDHSASSSTRRVETEAQLATSVRKRRCQGRLRWQPSSSAVPRRVRSRQRILPSGPEPVEHAQRAADRQDDGSRQRRMNSRSSGPRQRATATSRRSRRSSSGAVYVPDWGGYLNKLDASTGATIWSQHDLDYDRRRRTGRRAQLRPSTATPSTSATRTAATSTARRTAASCRDQRDHGRLLWSTQVDAIRRDPDRRRRSSRTASSTRASPPARKARPLDPTYPCCTFRGSVVAVNAATRSRSSGRRTRCRKRRAVHTQSPARVRLQRQRRLGHDARARPVEQHALHHDRQQLHASRTRSSTCQPSGGTPAPCLDPTTTSTRSWRWTRRPARSSGRPARAGLRRLERRAASSGSPRQLPGRRRARLRLRLRAEPVHGRNGKSKHARRRRRPEERHLLGARRGHRARSSGTRTPAPAPRSAASSGARRRTASASTSPRRTSTASRTRPGRRARSPPARGRRSTRRPARSLWQVRRPVARPLRRRQGARPGVASRTASSTRRR